MERKSHIEEAQLAKLRLEIEELRRKSNWKFQLLQFLPLLTVIAAVVGVSLSIKQFYVAQDKERAARVVEENQRMEAGRKEAETKERESKKPFLDRQLAAYFDACEAASTIAMLPVENPKRRSAEERFRQMYLGEFALVEDASVATAKTNFFNCLEELDASDTTCTVEPNRSEKLKDLSWALASSCRDAIAKRWTIDLSELENPYRQHKERRLP
jgi:hypothetical protein